MMVFYWNQVSSVEFHNRTSGLALSLISFAVCLCGTARACLQESTAQIYFINDFKALSAGQEQSNRRLNQNLQTRNSQLLASTLYPLITLESSFIEDKLSIVTLSSLYQILSCHGLY